MSFLLFRDFFTLFASGRLFRRWVHRRRGGLCGLLCFSTIRGSGNGIRQTSQEIFARDRLFYLSEPPCFLVEAFFHVFCRFLKLPDRPGKAFGKFWKFIRVRDNEVPIAPGMAVRAEIKTGERRVIEFFISPFIKYVDESLTLR